MTTATAAAAKESDAKTPRRKITPVTRIGPSSLSQGREGGVGRLASSSLGVIEGMPGSWGATAVGTGVRALIIGGVLYWIPGGEKRPGTVALQSIVASAAVTVFLFASHAIARRS